MAEHQALLQVAELLPPDRREAFFACAARFRDVPADDEYLLILEAIGFMTLIWSEVPNHVLKVLEGANPITETCQSVAKQVRIAVQEAIPSHEDLRQITRELQEHQLALKQAISRSNQQQRSPTIDFMLLLFVFLAGAILSLFATRSLEAPDPAPVPRGQAGVR